MCEIALVSSKRSRLESRLKMGDKRASTVLKVLGEPEKFLSAIQVGMTLVGIVSGAYGGVAFAEKLAPTVAKINGLAPYAYQISWLFVITILTFLSIILGELVPKTISISNPEKIALKIAPIIRIFTRISYPIVLFLSATTKVFLKLLFIKPHEEQSISEEELKMLINQANKQGVIEKKESEFMHNIFRFADRKANSIMTHRNNVTWVDQSLEPEEIKKIISESSFSKFPVYKETIDIIVGIINAKDFLSNYGSENFNLSALLTQPVYIPESLPAIKILELFRNERSYYGIVVNEYGSTEGVLTLHDLTENIFGYLPDVEEPDIPEVLFREDGSMLVDGDILIDELQEHIPLKEFLLKERNYNTLAGFILFKLRRIPSAGNYFTEGGYKFEIVDMDRSKIDKIIISKTIEEE